MNILQTALEAIETLLTDNSSEQAQAAAADARIKLANAMAVEPVAFKQFLSDVITAAGLIAHGKQCKALGERLSDIAYQYMQHPPQQAKREPLSEVQLFVLWHSLPEADGEFPDFLDAARAIEQAHHITSKALKP